jgi:peptidoglycan/xylan/chitin deacetylase (PgdA/CDA1 family)
MRIPGLKSLRHRGRRVRSRFVNGGLILGYHRVDDVLCDPYKLSVKPENFAQQLEVLKQYALPLSLSELVERLKKRGLPRRAVALTFDDGYADIVHKAKPFLDRFEMPASVFVVAGSLGNEFWWDELARLLGEPQCRAKIASPSNKPGHESDQGSRSGADVVLRQYGWLRELAAADREKAMASLRAFSSRASDATSGCRAVTREELVQLAKSPQIEIGAHTVTHPVLTNLSQAAQKEEIQQSKLQLEAVLGRPVTSFSYPNGSFSRVTRALVWEAGFSYACGSAKDLAWHRTDLFHLPRFWVPDCGGDIFSQWLRRLLR